ncbi:uncharacterized protein DDB_G0292186-like isoform X3 [Maniola jurtina]|uniref:uncharacterized protein DDB_G0292186-like isoform X3 n=1 Tax=Maniola jurtina TaxID=191418 RepID=UPI001E686622|nr:uncharacterized protein DDB_G0292186-like isoform X3 [Maniola jurtina]
MDVKTKPCTYVKSENNRINKLDMIVDNILDDDICEIIDIDTPNANIKRSNKVRTETIKSPIVLQKYYNPFDSNIIAEIDLTNVDDVISENQSIIDKYSKHNILSSVNLVETNVARPGSVENTNKPKNVASMQFGSKNNQTNTDQTTKHNQFFSSELEKIVKDFFNKRGNTSCPHNRAIRPLVLHGSEKMFPVCSLNNSLNNPIQRNFPELSLNNSLNNPIQRNFPELSLNNSLNNPIQRNFPELSLNNSLNNPIQRNFPELSLNNSLNNPIQRNFPELFLNNSLSPNKQSKRKRRNKDKSQSKADNNINPSTTNLFNVNNNVETPSQPSLGTCPICLDDLTRERVGSTNCGHLFCMPCLSTALKTKPKRCPTCRKKLTGLGYHQIFV